MPGLEESTFLKGKEVQSRRNRMKVSVSGTMTHGRGVRNENGEKQKSENLGPQKPWIRNLDFIWSACVCVCMSW